MTKAELIKEFKNIITAEEWNILKDKENHSLIINDFNRNVICRMMNNNMDNKDIVDEINVNKLKTLLIHYLQEYMQEQPSAHKWIIIASLYLTFIENKPMHPLEKVGIVVSEMNEKIIYRCPCKEKKKNSVCNYCVSRKL